MARGCAAAMFSAAVMLQQALAVRTDTNLDEAEDATAKHNMKSFRFEPPTIDDFRKLDDWDDWWAADALNGVLAPMCALDKNFKTAGMQDIDKNSDDEFRPDQDHSVLKSMETFDTEVDPEDEEEMAQLKTDLCEERELEEDEDEVLDGGLGCQLLYPPRHFGNTGASDLVMACKVVPQDGGATAEGLLQQALVEQFPAGWWQNEMLQNEWRRWFIAGYAPLKELEGMMFDGSQGDIALMSALFMLPTPTVKLNKKISPRGTNKAEPSYAQADIDAESVQVQGPLRVQLYEVPPEQPTSFLSFSKYLSQGQNPVEFSSIYEPRRGSLQHAAAMNQQEDIVLIFTIPLALKDSTSTPYCDDGWQGLAPNGVSGSVEVLQNLLRPIFPTNCQYYDKIANMNAVPIKDWYHDFSDPRRLASNEAYGVDGDKTPAQEIDQAFDTQTCPCKLSSCKFANYFEGPCPAPKKPEGKESKDWKAEWGGTWVDLTDTYKDCPHVIKKSKGKWIISFRTGKNKAKGVKTCTGATGLNTFLYVLEPTPTLNVYLLKVDPNEHSTWRTLKIVRVKKTVAPKKIRKTFYIKEGDDRIWQRTKKQGR